MIALTAIMPTTGRRAALLPLSIGSFIHQAGVPRRDLELLVISEDEEALTIAESFKELCAPATLTLRSCRPGLMVGAKRNWACQHAQGDWFAFWDDDDWSHPQRIAATLPLLQPGVELVGSRTMLIHEILDPRRRTFCFEYPRAKFDEEKYFVGGLLAFHRSLWNRAAFNPNQYSGEDGWWVLERLREGTAFHEITDPTLYVAMRHTDNTGNTQTPSGDPWWQRWKGDLNALMGAALPQWERAFGVFDARRAAEGRAIAGTLARTLATESAMERLHDEANTTDPTHQGSSKP